MPVHQPQAVRGSPSVISVVLMPFLRANQKCNGSHDRTVVATRLRTAAFCLPAHGPRVNDLFLIRTEEGRRTTEITEAAACFWRGH